MFPYDVPFLPPVKPSLSVSKETYELPVQTQSTNMPDSLSVGFSSFHRNQ